jgi:uncharacterized protein (DUF427 family)
MPKALWNGAVVAQSDACETFEGDRYFPATAAKREHLRPSTTRTECYWKGTANYYEDVVDGKVNKDAAWYYAEPKPAAANIRGYVAFWRGVTVEG